MAGTLANKIAFVTGSESGIGQAIAEEFARAGADVVVTFYADRAGAEEAGRRVEAAGRRVHLQQLDVRDEASVAMAFRDAAARLGTPDILVNAAGVIGKGMAVADMPAEEFDRVVKTDLYGPFFCCREFVRRRQAAGGKGRIINITSVHEAIPSPQQAAYGAAKGGLLTFTRSLALEVASLKINVNAIAPGLTHTPMTEYRFEQPETNRAMMARIPLNRAGQPAEVAKLALYLASDDADYITGQSFTIDGGLELDWGQGA